MSTLLSSLISLLGGCVRNKYETPAYKVISSEGVFEIRDYPQMVLISTPMQNRGSDGSFMKLFRFIQGRNDHEEKIAMTTPVLIAGTDQGTMSFILPEKFAEKGAPASLNPDVSVHMIPPARYAALRFSGSINSEHSESEAKKLASWTSQHSLTTIGTPLFAYYNPPWTPGFMRRNEVLIRLPPTP